jgi:hypothetical protein
LLLEPQRTNSATFSESFNNAAYTKSQTSVTANAIASPDGNTSADFIIPSVTSGLHSVLLGGASVSSGTHTLSVFAKQGLYKNLLVWFDGHSGGVGVNLDTLAVFRDENNSGYKIENYGNGWVRISVTCAISKASPPNFYIYDNSATPVISWAGNGTDGLYLWGAQLEAGAYATSYIPTLGASVTRVADACSKTGISSLIGQTEGTLFVDFNWEQKSGVFFVNSISDGTTSNEIFMAFGSTADNRLRFSIASSGVGASVSFDSATLASGRYKVAFAYANNDAAAYINGVQQFTDTSVTVPATSEFKFLRANNTLGFEGTINQQLLFKTRLTNSQLAELTA